MNIRGINVAIKDELKNQDQWNNISKKSKDFLSSFLQVYCINSDKGVNNKN